jgi:chaperonin cofactor prefoldin
MEKTKENLDLITQISDLKRQLEIKELRIKQLEDQLEDVIDFWNEHHKL